MVKIEVCVDSVQGLRAAIEGGADRVELCSALNVGGLSPNSELIAVARSTDVPVMVMVRPRAEGFCWDEAEIQQCFAEIAAVREAGLAGVVIGAAHVSGALDLATLERFMAAAKGLDITLHRVVDETPNPVQAAMAAEKLGIRRILSSGGSVSAIDGLEVLQQMARAASKTSIMPGAGVAPENIARIVKQIEASEIHGSFSVGGITNVQRVKAAKAAISGL